MRSKRIPLLIILVLLLLPSVIRPGHAQSPDSRYFPETDLTISGPVLEFYNSLKDPLRSLGFPITRQYTDPLTQAEVQYFQKARLEIIDGQVSLSPLGKWLYNTGAPKANVKTRGPACQYFAETQHSVCYGFLQFYKAYDGEELLGQPISDVEWRENRYTQYFTNARLEWRTENPEGMKVVVSDLGRIYFDKVVDDPSVTRPPEPTNIIVSQVKLSAHAFVARPLLPVGGEQTVFVLVQNQGNVPVEGVSVAVIVHLPDGEPLALVADATNADGITQISFPMDIGSPRTIVPVEVLVTRGTQETRAQTWFRLWW
jgi:hypothetical protein